MNNIYHLVGRYGYSIRSSSVNADWSLSEEIKSDIVGAELVVVNGEGTIHHDAYFARKILEVGKFCQLYNVKSFLINSTIQEMEYDGFFECMRSFDGIYVREYLSKEYLSNIGVKSTVVPDMTFYNSTGPSKVRSGVSTTCSVYESLTFSLAEISISNGFEFTNIHYEGLPRGSYSSGERSLSVVRSFLNRCLRHIRGYKMIPKKLIFRNKLTRVLKKLKVFEFNNHVSYQEHLSKKELVICGRYHAMCMSIANRVPVLALESNSFKVSGLISDIGLNKRRIVSESQLYELNGDFRFEYTSEELSKLDSYVSNAKKSIDDMFEEIFY